MDYRPAYDALADLINDGITTVSKMVRHRSQSNLSNEINLSLQQYKFSFVLSVHDTEKLFCEADRIPFAFSYSNLFDILGLLELLLPWKLG